jgi:uncharacterized metal-binding protein (TIGR02443 family)
VSRPRFIAGAVCPACGAMDRLQLLEADGDQRRRCVACGHEDSLASTASRAPATRLDGGLKTPDPSAASPIRILDPGNEETGGKPD